MQFWQILLVVLAAFDVIVLARHFATFWRVVSLVATGTPDTSAFPVGIVASNGVTASDRPVMNLIRFYGATFMCTAFLFIVAFGAAKIPDIGRLDGAMLAGAILGTLSVILPPRVSRFANAIATVISLHPPRPMPNRGASVPFPEPATEIERKYNEAYRLVAEDNLEEAERRLGEIISENPKFAPAHRELAHVLRKRGKTEQALHHRLQLKRLEPSDLKNRHNLADTLLELRRPQEALREADELLALEPKNERFKLLRTAALTMANKALNPTGNNPAS